MLPTIKVGFHRTATAADRFVSAQARLERIVGCGRRDDHQRVARGAGTPGVARKGVWLVHSRGSQPPLLRDSDVSRHTLQCLDWLLGLGEAALRAKEDKANRGSRDASDSEGSFSDSDRFVACVSFVGARHFFPPQRGGTGERWLHPHSCV